VTVQPGDTLWTIAAIALGDGDAWPASTVPSQQDPQSTLIYQAGAGRAAGQGTHVSGDWLRRTPPGLTAIVNPDHYRGRGRPPPSAAGLFFMTPHPEHAQVAQAASPAKSEKQKGAIATLRDL
jgi:hypothetical protein